MVIERIHKTYIGYFLLYAIVLLIIAGIYLWIEHEQDIELHKTNEKVQIELAKISIERDLVRVLPDLTLLAGDTTIVNYLKGEEAALYQQLSSSFQAFAQQKRLYSMVRILDKTGQERLRVEYKQGEAHVIDQNILQDKSKRYYFQDTIGLGAGELYISPMDLNMEHGEIEKPYNPVLRFATPVVDKDGNNLGVIVLNYMAEQLLQHFDEMLVGSGGHVALLNSQGYWLRSHHREREWGFMLDTSLAYYKVHPDEWQEFVANRKGQFINERGLFTYSSLYPLKLVYEYSDRVFDTKHVGHRHSNPDEYFWIIKSDVTMESIHGRIIERVLGKLAFTFSLALLLGMLTIALLARLRSQRESFQSQLELHAMLYANTTEGVMITDEKGYIIEVNDAFQEITHYSSDDVIGQTPRILSSGRQDKAFYETMWSELNSNGAWEGEITNRRKDGTLIVEWLRIYVIKDEKGRVANNIAVFSDITGKKLTEEEMHRRAHQDPLTGLANRLSFDERLQQDLARARRSNNRLALLFIDLDKFKPINDIHGHHAGDEVLLEVSRRLLKELREVDTVARVGGDEFVIILAELSSPKDIESVAERILHSLRQAIPFNGMELYISASIGISLYPDDGLSERELIANADQAMYEVKRNYRDGYGYFGSVKDFSCEKAWTRVRQNSN